MPITKSQGKAPEAWTVELDRARTSTAIRHELPPRSPSTTEGTDQPPPPPPAPRGGEDAPLPTQSKETERTKQIEQPSTSKKETRLEGTSDKTLKPSDKPANPDKIVKPSDKADRTYRKIMPITTRGDVRNEHRGPPSTTNRTTRSIKKISRAREDLLKIRLELAQIALQRAEEEDSDGNMDDRNSNNEYVQSWLEEAPEPEPLKEVNAAEGNSSYRSRKAADTQPPPEDIESVPDHRQMQVPLLTERPIVNEVKNLVPSKDPGEGQLRPFITELTSAIASLADKKTEAWTTNNPSASKVIMTLPNYSGAHTEWLSFRAIYETTRRYFNDVENTARLRRSLRGRALETVSSELIGHAKPDEIMRELELQFGRPDSIAQAETDRLRGLPRCSESPKDICTFASRVRSGIVTLRALKKEHYLINAELMRLLTEKLPNSLRVQWYRTYTEKYQSLPDLSLFSDFITEQARFCSAFAPPENIAPVEATASTATKRVTHRTHTATAKTAMKCRVCNKEGHYASDCTKFKEASIDKKWEWAKKLRMCFRCLRDHRPDHICKKKKCGVKECTATHNPLLHYAKKPAAEVAEKPEAPDQKEPQETVASSRSTSNQTYLKIVPVRVIGPAGEAATFALLDDGSTVSLIDEDVAKQVGAEGRIDPLKIGAIGNTTIDTPQSRRVTVDLASQLRSKVPFKARTIPKLNLAPQTVSEQDIAQCKHLEGLRQQLTYNTGAPKILIGQDNWHLLLASEIRRGPRHQPIASLTTMGWTLHGAHTRILGQQVHYVNRLTTSDEELNEQLREYFALESLMINPRRPNSDPEKKAEDILNRHTQQLEDGHIETAMLWKNESIEMPDSYGTALKRLVSIEKKLDSNPALRDRYTEQMDSLMRKGYAEKAPKTNTPGRTWYLPHFDVFNPMKPEKLRIVHDAAAKTRGLSLNDFLLTGPDLLQSLPGVMMRFRRHCIAISGDIAEMFMQVKVRAQDRDALRYLWRGKNREGAPEEYRMTSIIFGAASSPCTAIFAKNWNAKRHLEEHPEAVEAIIHNHYMDDYLDSYKTVEDATRIATTVKNIHLKAKFELKKWVSNSVQVIENIDPSQTRTEIVSIGDTENTEKILGLIWRPGEDALGFNLTLARLPKGVLEKEVPTKREALRIVMSLYDPLGLASPVTIRAKQILQEAWRRGVDWDQALDKDLETQWRIWIQHLQQLKNISIPTSLKQTVKKSDIQIKKQIIEAEFLQEAEKILIRVVQQQSFAHEIARLREQKTLEKDSRLRPLQIEVVDNVLRLKSRIAATEEITDDVRRPPILHGDHHISQLYIDWTHRSLQHSGVELTINEVRQHYWVVKMRPTTKMVLSRCLQCRIRKAQAPVPATGDHPKTRLAHHKRPFTYTGLDYFGPLSVTVGRQHQKRYVALFTCLTTRAVHLEVAASLSADSAILALRRFAARRGCPTELHSDNGTNMHGANKELRDAFREEASRRGIVWRFITPSAPFMGGAWERLVRCVKSALNTVLLEKHPHEEVLSTLLCEAEYTVNSRPLTHVSVDSEDDESITPNHFLLGGSARLPSPGIFTEQDMDSKKLWRRSQILADMFWRRWVREYLPELQNRREPHSRGPELQVGDPILIADGQLPRNTWPRGRIIAVFPGADGEVRTAEVRTAGGTLKRPVKKLVPLPK